MGRRRMLMAAGPRRYRVLVVDDNPAIHDDLRKILGGESPTAANLDALEAELLGTVAPAAALPVFEIDSAFQGQDGLQCVERAVADDDPYALAFVDVRMPPGWDGIETVERIWRVAPDLHVTICTAYTDYDWEDIVARLPQSDQLLIVKKPFEIVEARQIAACMAAKWTHLSQLRGQIDALRTLAREREHAAARAIELAEMQARFVAMASHEIRTPLSTIFAAVENLARYVERMTPEQREQRVHKIQGQIQHLTAILDDVLAIAPLEGGTRACRRTPVDLAELCRDVVAQTDPLQKGPERVRVSSEPGPTAAVDPTLMRQVLSNLIGNALKYSPPAAPVDVAVLRRDGAVVVRVVDRGIGIPPEDQARLFEPFHRASNVGTVPGSGLGMVVVRRAVERQDGAIRVESRVGHGTTVDVILPVLAPDGLEPARDPGPSAEGAERP